MKKFCIFAVELTIVIMSKLKLSYWFGWNLFQNNIPLTIVNSTEMMVLRQTTSPKDFSGDKIKLAITDKNKPHDPSACNVLGLTTSDMITKFHRVPSYMVTNCLSIA